MRERKKLRDIAVEIAEAMEERALRLRWFAEVDGTG
jgi:hypothetical protein